MVATFVSMSFNRVTLKTGKCTNKIRWWKMLNCVNTVVGVKKLPMYFMSNSTVNQYGEADYWLFAFHIWFLPKSFLTASTFCLHVMHCCTQLIAIFPFSFHFNIFIIPLVSAPCFLAFTFLCLPTLPLNGAR